jgi:LAS superfamily LD-carboxypeptidase LdcB
VRRIILANIFLLLLIAAVVVGVWVHFQMPLWEANQATSRIFAQADTRNLIAWHYAYLELPFANPKLNAAEALVHYSQAYQSFNQVNLTQLTPIDISQVEFTETTAKPEPMVVKQDANLPKDIEVITQPAQPRKVLHGKGSILINNNPTTIDAEVVELQKSIAETRLQGTGDKKLIFQQLQSQYDQLIADLITKNTGNLNQYTDITTAQLTKLHQREKLSDVLKSTKAVDLIWRTPQTIQKGRIYDVAEFQLVVEQKDCPAKHYVTLYFDVVSYKWRWSNVNQTLSDLCTSPGVIQLTCTDCVLAPVDKVHKLPSGYAPYVVDTKLPGGGRMTPLAARALANLFAEARKQGITGRVFSAYRSYDDQFKAFDYWYKLERAKGKPHAVAMVDANKYSAYPGHSEHQLGTTVDVGCGSCDVFDDNPGNIALWVFIERRGHEFGFVISYPRYTEHLTGYKYEPWHIRFVGVQLATELHKTGYAKGDPRGTAGNNANFLAKFLRAKGNF